MSHGRQPGAISPKPEHINPNLLINGGMRIWQRGNTIDASTAFVNSDNKYTADRWLFVSDGNDAADLSLETTTVPTGSYASMKLLVVTANKKFGIVQMLESVDSTFIKSGTVSFSFKASQLTGLQRSLRAAVISWKGTKDTLTDPISTWEAAGTDPVLATDWSYESSGTNLPLDVPFQTFSFRAIEVDSTTPNNTGVFIWVDDTDLSASNAIYITDVKLEVGIHTTDFEARSMSDELHLCQRYFCKTFDQDTTPAQNAGLNGALGTVASGTAAGDLAINWFFPATLRLDPASTTVFYNPSAASADWRDINASADIDAALQESGHHCITVDNTEVTTDSNQHFIHVTVDGELA